MTAKTAILERIKEEGVFLAIHELHIRGYSENCLATRASEMAHDKVLVGRYRVGENFKEWGLPEWVEASAHNASKSSDKADLPLELPLNRSWMPPEPATWDITEELGGW